MGPRSSRGAAALADGLLDPADRLQELCLRPLYRRNSLGLDGTVHLNQLRDLRRQIFIAALPLLDGWQSGLCDLLLQGLNLFVELVQFLFKIAIA